MAGQKTKRRMLKAYVLNTNIFNNCYNKAMG